MSGGVGAALEQAVKGEADMADVVQAGLFEELEPHETGDLGAASPLSTALGSRRRGRPKGAKNRRTEAVTAWLLSQHQHPLKVMMEAYSMSPEALAVQIGLRRAPVSVTVKTMVEGKLVETTTESEGESFSNDVLLDILKLQVRMAEAVAPYVAQKMTSGSDAGDGAQLNVTFAQLNIGGGGGSGVSVPARGVEAEVSTGVGMSVRLGQVGRDKSDDALSSE